MTSERGILIRIAAPTRRNGNSHLAAAGYRYIAASLTVTQKHSQRRLVVVRNITLNRDEVFPLHKEGNSSSYEDGV